MLSWQKSSMSRLSWTSYCNNLDVNRKRATDIWVHMGKRLRSQWIDFMLQELKARPRRALIPLDVALHNPGSISRRWISDCILMIARYLLEDKANPLQMDIRMLHQFVCDYTVMNSSYDFNKPLKQMLIWLILVRCDHSQLRSLFESILTNRLPLSSHTLLQFANRFMSFGQAHVGLEIIRNVVSLGADTSSFALQSSCVKLLETRPDRDDWYDYQDTVVTELLDLGIRPNVILWTCIMQNAVEAGRFAAAWRWFGLGIRDGLTPTSPTILVILKMAKAQKSKEILERAIHEAHKAGVLPNDLKVVFGLLHAVLVIELGKVKTSLFQENLFTSCLRHYVQYCDIGPLQELGCQLDDPASEWQPSDRQLPTPGPTILSLMMVAYIRRRGARKELIDFYVRYNGLVTSEHPLYSQLACTDYVSNAFLMRLGTLRSTLPYCTTVIKSMIESRPPRISPSSEWRSTTANQTGQPTLTTWNILLRAYMLRGQTAAAEKVVSMLKARGFEPNKITWTQMISSYLDRQQIGKVVSVAKTMKDAGIEYDDIMIRTLQRIKDKPRFFKAMDDDNAEPEYLVYYNGDKPSRSRLESPTHESFLEKGSSGQTDEDRPLKFKLSLDYT